MATEIQGIDIIVEVRDASDSPATWKRLVCEVDNQAEMDNEVSETDTKCGTFTGVKDMKGNYSGNAVSNAVPTSSEFSYEDVVTAQEAKTLLDFRFYNAAFGAVAEGAAVFQQCTGRFTNSVLTSAAGEVVQFSWTFSPSGTISLVPVS
jgi:hypothetical protein